MTDRDPSLDDLDRLTGDLLSGTSSLSDAEVDAEIRRAAYPAAEAAEPAGVAPGVDDVGAVDDDDVSIDADPVITPDPSENTAPAAFSAGPVIDAEFADDVDDNGTEYDPPAVFEPGDIPSFLLDGDDDAPDVGSVDDAAGPSDVTEPAAAEGDVDGGVDDTLPPSQPSASPSAAGLAGVLSGSSNAADDYGETFPDTSSTGQDADAAAADDGQKPAEDKGSPLSALRGNRKLIVVAALAVAALVIWIAASVFGGGGGPASSDTGSEAQEGPVEFGGSSGGGESPPADQPIAPSSANAACQSGSTSIDGALDDQPSTAWICKRTLGIDGNVATFTFDRPVVITHLSIVAGNNQASASGEDRWSQFRVVTRIRVTAAGVSSVYAIDAKPTAVDIPLTSPQTTSDMEIVVLRSEPANAAAQPDDAFAVSQLTFLGRYAH